MCFGLILKPKIHILFGLLYNRYREADNEIEYLVYFVIFIISLKHYLLTCTCILYKHV